MTIISGTVCLQMRDIRATSPSSAGHRCRFHRYGERCRKSSRNEYRRWRCVQFRVPDVSLECASHRHGFNGFVVVNFFFNKDRQHQSLRLSVVSSNIARSAGDLRRRRGRWIKSVMVCLMFVELRCTVYLKRGRSVLRKLSRC